MGTYYDSINWLLNSKLLSPIASNINL